MKEKEILKLVMNRRECDDVFSFQFLVTTIGGRPKPE